MLDHRTKQFGRVSQNVKLKTDAFIIVISIIKGGKYGQRRDLVGYRFSLCKYEVQGPQIAVQTKSLQTFFCTI